AGCHDPRLAERRMVAVDARGIEEPADVVGQAEHHRPLGRVVDPDALENRGAVVEAVAHHMHLGVAPGLDLAIHPDVFGQGLHYFYAWLAGLERAPTGWIC